MSEQTFMVDGPNAIAVLEEAQGQYRAHRDFIAAKRLDAIAKREACDMAGDVIGAHWHAAQASAFAIALIGPEEDGQ